MSWAFLPSFLPDSVKELLTSLLLFLKGWDLNGKPERGDAPCPPDLERGDALCPPSPTLGSCYRVSPATAQRTERRKRVLGLHGEGLP